MTPHAKLLEEICAYLKSVGAWYVRTNNHGYGRRGIPDVVACVNGRFVAVEAKVKPDHPSAWQQREIAAIHIAGGSALVAYDLDGLKRVCDDLFRAA